MSDGSAKAGVDTNTLFWLRGASLVNKNETPFATLIREYTSQQKLLRDGTPLDVGQLQALSNEVADAVVETIVLRQTLPTIDIIADRDASITVGEQFNGSEAAWSGNILFLGFGHKESFDEYLIAPGESSYDLVAAIASLMAAGTATWGDPDAWDDNLKEFYSILGEVAGDVFTGNGFVIAGAALDASNFLADTYGSTSKTGALPTLALLNDNLVVGTIGDDTGLARSSSDDLLQAGSGDDRIVATAGSDLIDGDVGYDVADYRGIGEAVTFNFGDTVAEFSARFVGLAGNESLGVDWLYNVEKVIASDGDDRIFQRGLLEPPEGQPGQPGLEIDAAGGDMDLFAAVGLERLTYDGSATELSQAGGSVSFANVERFMASSFGDEVTAGGGFAQIDGGYGNDLMIAADGTGDISGGVRAADAAAMAETFGIAASALAGLPDDDVLFDNDDSATTYVFGKHGGHDTVFFTNTDLDQNDPLSEIYFEDLGLDDVEITVGGHELYSWSDDIIQYNDVAVEAVETGATVVLPGVMIVETWVGDPLSDGDYYFDDAAWQLRFADGATLDARGVFGNVDHEVVDDHELSGHVTYSDPRGGLDLSAFSALDPRFFAALGADVTAGGLPEPAPPAQAGTDGPDVLAGTAGADTILAGAGDDTLVASAGDDVLDGGAGADTVDYGATQSGVDADLAAGTASGSEIGSDTLASLERVVAGAGNDTLLGRGPATTSMAATGRIDWKGAAATTSCMATRAPTP